jgi:hypothetical protein
VKLCNHGKEHQELNAEAPREEEATDQLNQSGGKILLSNTRPEEGEQESMPDDGDMVGVVESAGVIVPWSQVNNYTQCPAQFNKWSLYDYCCWVDVTRSRADSKLAGEDGNTSLAVPEHAPLPQVDNRTRFALLVSEPARRTHIAILRNSPYILEYVGGSLPRRNHGDFDFYCQTMLALFAPGWRSGSNLKVSAESWEEAFERTCFKTEHEQVMKNMNLLHEYYNARSDFGAKRKCAGLSSEPAFSFLTELVDAAVLESLDKSLAQEEVLDDVTSSDCLDAIFDPSAPLGDLTCS